MLGVAGNTPGIAHHNVYFSGDQRVEFTDIFGENGSGVPRDPTIYVCCSSVTDATAAPTGKENWFVLVNVAAGAQAQWDEYRDMLTQRLGLTGRIEVSEMITPDDIADRYRAPGGAIYGTSSNSRSSAFLRAANRGPVHRLYLCGGSAHPGGGLPLVAMSGAIAAAMVQADLQ